MYLYWLQATIDETTVQMVITVKLTKFITDTVLSKSDDQPAVDSDSEPDKYPELLEFLGFIYFIPSYFTGVTLTLQEYNSYIQYLQTRDCSDTHSNETKSQLYLISAKTTLLFVCATIGMVLFSPFYMITPAFAAYGFMDKMFYLFISMFLVRCKYYFAWSLSEISYIISDCSNFVSHRGRNVHIVDVELPQNTYQILNSWNVCTNTWLKTTVYQNVLTRYGAKVAVIATNVVSAFWHGFYITFVFGGVSTILGRMWRKNISKAIVQPTQNDVVLDVYWYIKIPMMLSLINFFGLPFQLYSLYYVVDAYNALHWYGLILCIIGFIVAFATPIVMRRMFNTEISNKCKDE